MDLTDSELSNNSADYGGAVFLSTSDMNLTDSTIADNVSVSNGGAGYIYAYEGASSINLNDSLVTGNTSTNGYGGAFYMDGYYYAADLSCSGTSSATSGITDNTANYYGGGIATNGSLSSIDAQKCDFGTASGGDANEPAALNISYYYSYEPGNDATFTCDGTDCGSATTNYHGDTDNVYTTTGLACGNVVLANTTATINDFSPYLSTSGTCTIEHYVLSSSSSSGPWEYEWWSTQSTSGTSYLTSNPVGLAVENGRYYALFSASDCSDSLTQYWSTSPAYGTDAGFGEIVGMYLDASYTYSAYTSGIAKDALHLYSGYSWFGYTSTTEL